MDSLQRDIEELRRENTRTDRRLMAVEAYPMKLVALETELAGMKENVDLRIRAMQEDLEEIKGQFVQRQKERKVERERAEQQERSARRFNVTVTLGASGLVLTGVGLLLAAFGVGG